MELQQRAVAGLGGADLRQVETATLSPQSRQTLFPHSKGSRGRLVIGRKVGGVNLFLQMKKLMIFSEER